jgi:hypothetical protein
MDFGKELNAYRQELFSRLMQCYRTSRSDVSNQVRVNACSGTTATTYYIDCGSELSEYECGAQRAKFESNLCLSRLKANNEERRSAEHEAALERRLMLDTARGVPGVAATNFQRMGKLLSDLRHYKSSAAFHAIGIGLNQYDKTIKGPYDERISIIRQAVEKMADKERNLIAGDMIKVAIRGVEAVNLRAMDELSRELSRFSREIAADRAANQSRVAARGSVGSSRQGGPAIHEGTETSVRTPTVQTRSRPPAQQRQAPATRREARQEPAYRQGGGGGSRYSATRCNQLLAQIRELERVQGAYDAQGYGGMIRQGISANRAAYNSGCR